MKLAEQTAFAILSNIPEGLTSTDRHCTQGQSYMADDKIELHCGANPRFCDFNTIINSILADNMIFHPQQSPPPTGPELKCREFKFPNNPVQTETKVCDQKPADRLAVNN